MPEVGIVMILKDRISNTMSSIKNSGQALSKEFDELYEWVSKNAAQQTTLAKELPKTKVTIEVHKKS